uniref:Uncharacterized protein n=1 Tax=Oncorhynchus kisutch TaxID=8019 RepID=A0A8C7CI85_ONCKI
MMDAREEMLTLLQKLWAKLQGLPTASPLEMGAFAVLVLFIGKLHLSLTHTHTHTYIHTCMYVQWGKKVFRTRPLNNTPPYKTHTEPP